MKSRIIKMHVPISILILSLLTACAPADPAAELEKLKTQKQEIEARIAELESQVNDSSAVSTQGQGPEVAVLVLKPSYFKSYIDVQAHVDADQNVSLSSSIPGTVTRINVKVGDKVSEGQVLAETDARVIQQQISDLQTNYELAKQVYEKQENLWNQKIGTEIQYLQAKSTKESLEKKLATLEEQLRMSRVVSPINGTVDGVNIKIGQTIAPGMNAITVVNFSSLKVKADVAESYSSRIKTGDEVWVHFPDLNDSLSSKVNYASRSINLLNRTFAVEVLLNTTLELHPNMVARLKINDYTSAQPCIVLPEKYIQRNGSETYVWLAEAGKAQKRQVRIGREYSGTAEILEGLKAGEELIVRGYDLIAEGDAVQVQN